MAWFKRRRHLTSTEERRVIASIGDAERGHRGEIRVHLEARYAGDGPVARAQSLYDELGIGGTEGGTGVLLYVGVLDRQVAVWAGPGLYESAREPGFWSGITKTVAEGFANGDRAGGLERGLLALGTLLRQVAPGDDEHGNELPDTVSYS